MYTTERCSWFGPRGRGGWVDGEVVSPSGGCDGSYELPCGVEELNSSVYTVANTCEASMEKGRAYPSWLASSTSTSSSRWLPAWGLRASPNSMWGREPPTGGKADPTCSVSVDSRWAAGPGHLSILEAEEARGLRPYLLVWPHDHFR